MTSALTSSSSSLSRLLYHRLVTTAAAAAPKVNKNSHRCTSNVAHKKHTISSSEQHSLSNGTLRQKLRSGQPTLGVVTGFHNDTDHAETLGLLGYDFLWADAEHSTANASTVANLILAAERRGAQGIIFPQCESADDVHKIVDAVKFPPIGKRGLAGERWNAWGLGGLNNGGGDVTLADCVRTSNNNSIVGVVVESRRGIEALDEILSVEHVDFVFVAPTDLSADMGLHGQIRHPDVVDMVDKAGQRIRAAGVSSGMLALNGDDYVKYRQLGFQVMVGVAHTMFVEGARSLKCRAEDFESSGGK
eukprot:scaffold4123_cov145-Skeletonema_menzelii.AAC.4